MDAVKNEFENIGGNIKIIFVDQKRQGFRKIKFKIMIPNSKLKKLAS